MKTDFTPIAADTRINVKIKAQNETEINGQGPKLTEEEISAFTEKFDHLTSDDVVIFAGSLVPSLNDDFYFDLIKIIRSKGAQFVIDTTDGITFSTISARSESTSELVFVDTFVEFTFCPDDATVVLFPTTLLITRLLA